MRSSMKKKGGSFVYSWVKGERSPPIAAVRTKPDKENSHADTDEIVEALRKVWDKYFNAETTTKWEQFKDIFERYIKQ